jgi:hypothetical protein
VLTNLGLGARAIDAAEVVWFWVSLIAETVSDVWHGRSGWEDWPA